LVSRIISSQAVRAERPPLGVQDYLQPGAELGEDVSLVLLRPVDDERPPTGHHREVPDVELGLLDDLPVLLEEGLHPEGARIREVLVLALQL